MTPERWRRVEAVFHEVVDLPDDERTARLATTCASDDELRREVESLLASTPDAARSMRDAIATVAASLPHSQPLRIGERLGGRYLIEELLGEGGMGAVYRAVDERLGEAVALKVVRRSVDEQLLRDEVRFAQRVTHPNVCRTFDLEEVDGHQLVKMELVRGETLATRLQRERMLPVEECVRIARAVAAGLAAAHERDIVHGDLKPANIMLDGDRVVLMDFGIARVAAAPVVGVRGTVGYLAPELVRDRRADQRADLYALGCVLYEMLAGESVFPGSSTTQIGARHVAMPVPDLRTRRADTPRWLARAVADLLAKSPEDRDGGLARLLAGRRSRARIVAPIVVAVATAVTVTWWLTRPAPWVAQVHDYDGFDENVDAMSFSPDGEWVAFSSNRLGEGNPRIYLMNVRSGETRLLLPDQRGRDVEWSHDGSAILFVDEEHALRQRIAGFPPHAVGKPEDMGVAQAPLMCGDGVLIYERHLVGGRLLLHLPGGESRVVFTSRPGNFITSYPCDSKGEQIAVVTGNTFVGGHNDVYLVDLHGDVRQLTTDHRIGQSAIFSSDDRSLVVSRLVDGRTQLFELSLDGGHVRRLLDDGGNDEPLEISRDGRYLAFMRGTEAYLPADFTARGATPRTRQRAVYWFPREVRPNLVVAACQSSSGPQIALVREDSSVTILAPGWFPFPSLDGATIYYGGYDDRRELYAVPTNGGAPHRVATLPGMIDFGTAGPDGLHVSVELGDGHVAGFRVHDAVVEREADGLVSVAPDGGWRAVTVYGKTLLQLGAELYLVPPGTPLDQATQHVHVASPYSPWIDNHHVGYIDGQYGDVVSQRAEVLDAATGSAKTLSVEFFIPPYASVMQDGEHVLAAVHDPRYTRHVITNFGDR